MKEKVTPASEGRRMYSDLAWLFPLISPPDEYTDEAQEIREALNRHSKIIPITLLDLGSGGGHTDYHLKKHFEITGVDCSLEMVHISRRLNPEVTYHVGDMRTIRLGVSYDAVLITDALVYMLTEDDLRQAFQTAFQHLSPGGVFLTYVDAFRDHPKINEVRHSTYRYDNLLVTHIEHYYDPDPSDTTYEMMFINIIRRNGQPTVELDRHLGGVFDVEVYSRLLGEVGFKVVPSCLGDRSLPMFICQKEGASQEKPESSEKPRRSP